MSTRSIIVVTGNHNHQGKETIRLYKHADGYPAENLPLVAAAIRKAKDQCAEDSERFDRKTEPNTSQVAGLLIGEATAVTGMGAKIDDVFHEEFRQVHLGGQTDLEWIYEINLDRQTINVFGGSYRNCRPQEHCAAGFANLMDQDSNDKERTISAIKDIESLGFAVNRAP